MSINLIGLKENDKVLISVGGLVPRKGYHRVINVLPDLAQEFPDLKYLIVGGASSEGDYSETLQDQVASLALGPLCKLCKATTDMEAE